MNWQTPVALAIVGLTIVLFFVRRKKNSCGGNCGCTAKTKPPAE